VYHTHSVLIKYWGICIQNSLALEIHAAAAADDDDEYDNLYGAIAQHIHVMMSYKYCLLDQ